MLSVGQKLLLNAVTPRVRAADLARELGITSQAVSAWVRGLSKPSPEQMARLEEMLGIPMRSWLQREAERTRRRTGTDD